MTDIKCPEWCANSADHNPGDYMTFHYSGLTRFELPGGVVRVDGMLITGQLQEYPATVSTGVTAGDDIRFRDLTPDAARFTADILDVLSTGTPKRIREFAAGLRASADAIAPEAG